MTSRRDFNTMGAAATLGLTALAAGRASAQTDEPLTVEQAQAWLGAYKVAWESKDSDLLVSLFTPNGIYHDNPFKPAMVGHDAIRAYWDTTTVAQSGIAFTSEVWAVAGDVAFAHWAAEFTAEGAPVRLDGAFHLTLIPAADGPPIASHLREWYVMA